jgi:hypothetical protein
MYKRIIEIIKKNISKVNVSVKLSTVGNAFIYDK